MKPFLRITKRIAPGVSAGVYVPLTYHTTRNTFTLLGGALLLAAVFGAAWFVGWWISLL